MISLALFVVQFFALVFVVLCAEDGYDVSQIHIAQGRTPESMTISWVTKGAAKTEVIYGLSPKNLDNKAEGYTTSYDFNYPSFGMYQSGTIHHVQLSNLKPDTLYFYQCGDTAASAVSGLLQFRTMPAVGDKKPMRFAVIGDLGQTSDSHSTIQHVMQRSDLGMILHAGDLGYADCNQTLWDTYGEMVEDLAKER